MKNSRINWTTLSAMIGALILFAAGQGFIAAPIAGFIVFVINTAVVIKDKFSMTNDAYILAASILTGVYSVVEFLNGDPSIFPGLKPIILTTIMGVITIVLRYLSQPMSQPAK